MSFVEGFLLSPDLKPRVAPVWKYKEDTGSEHSEHFAFSQRTNKKCCHKPESMGEIPVAVVVVSSKLLL